jgi:GT2 family glycosyltransferase
VRDAGHAVACVNAIRVVHGKGGSSRHRPLFVAWHKHRGLWRWFRKFDPAARNPLLAGLVWLGIWVHFMLQLPALLLRKLRYRRGGNNQGGAGPGQ